MSTPSAPPSQAPIEIYLGKNGETFGPYTVEQFTAIQASAEFATYAFIWDGRDAAPDWKPIARSAPTAPPRKSGPSAPPPSEAVVSAAVVSAAAPTAEVREVPVAAAPAPAASARATRQALRGFDVPGIDALLHDSRSVISGKLMQVTDAGCDLICPDSVVAPTFGSQSSIVLNLLDPATGRSQNVSARLSGMRRGDGRWSLKVQWQGCPELVVQHLEKTA